MVVLPFLAMCFMLLKGFVYTIVVDIYAFRLAFSGILPCVLHQNALHLAPKHLAFSTKTHCILRQNALHLAPNSSETGANGGFFNKNSFCQHSHAPPFCIETNLRENRFFAARWAIGEQKGHL